MKPSFRRSAIIASATLILSVFTGLSASAQITPTSNTKTLSVKTVNTSQIEYVLNLTNPEVSADRVVQEFQSKKGIISAKAISATQVIIVTVPGLDHSQIIDVAKASGCVNTYKSYKKEKMDLLPAEEKKEDLH